jgi:hypothetical protein
MRTRALVFVTSALAGGVLGVVWNAPWFKDAYHGFISLFADPSAPAMGSAWAIVLFAFVIGVPRICVP